jgi:ectoine hydroxylase-related dioxygenase (phytanoyl-CoA dioxygenase family)
MDMMWQGDSDVLRLFALSPRLGRLAADLLEVADARLYHDNVLSKEPGCGRTPWHFDAHHFPIASRDIVTSWLPLQALPAAMGPLAFAAGAETWRVADDVDFAAQGDSYDRGVSKAFAAAGVEVDDTPFALGTVSFHHAWCFHYARGNGGTQPRRVLANTYFADGAKLVDEPTMVSGDYEKFLPGAKPGEVIDTPLNPIVSR